MKKLAIFIIILGLGFGAWQLLATKPDAGTPEAIITDSSTSPLSEGQSASEPTAPTTKNIDNAHVAIAFTGFGPGKKHNGSFSEIKSTLAFSTSGNLMGDVVVTMNSLSTDTEGVTKHLQTDAFFDVAKYPTATFVVTEDLTSSTCAGDNVRCKAPHLYGNFTIHGVTKGVSFPVVKSTDKYTATFTLNMKEFGINQTFANETIELTVTVPIINK